MQETKIKTHFFCKMGHRSHPQKWFHNSMGWFSTLLHVQLSNGGWIQSGYREISTYIIRNGVAMGIMPTKYVVCLREKWHSVTTSE